MQETLPHSATQEKGAERTQKYEAAGRATV
jgi:hypothetical protein